MSLPKFQAIIHDKRLTEKVNRVHNFTAFPLNWIFRYIRPGVWANLSSVSHFGSTMKVVRFLVLTLLLFEAAARGQKADKKCSQKADDGTCTQWDLPKSRQKRVVSLPNQSSLTMQSRLIVPQPPVGLYIVWVRVRFFIRSMFTEAQASWVYGKISLFVPPAAASKFSLFSIKIR